MSGLQIYNAIEPTSVQQVFYLPKHTRVMVGSWAEWLERGEKDLTVAKDEFEKQNYGHTGYCLQQAIEKHVKSLWVAGGIEDPKKLGHDIVGYFVRQIIDNLQEWEFGKEGLSKKEFRESMQTSKDIIDDIRSDDGLKGEFWMHSIGIKIDEPSECLKGYETNIKERFQKTSNTNGIVLIVAKAKKRAHSFARDGASDPAKIQSTAALATIRVTGLILLTYPHETYGRYPSSVKHKGEEKSVSDLYAEYSGGLKTLMDDTVTACSDLSCVARDLGAALDKQGRSPE